MAKRAMPADLFTPGQVVTVTNHYITSESHPCFGTNRRTIERVNGSSLYFTETGRVVWPKASQVWVDGPVVELRGGGCGQQPTDLFLTIVREVK